jgi:hypothetical protein
MTDFQYDVFRCHSLKDKPVVLKRLQAETAAELGACAGPSKLNYEFP